MTAKHGWKLLPLVSRLDLLLCVVLKGTGPPSPPTQYDVDPNTGLFFHSHNHSFADRQWLGAISYKDGQFHCPEPPQQDTPPGLEVSQVLLADLGQEWPQGMIQT